MTDPDTGAPAVNPNQADDDTSKENPSGSAATSDEDTASGGAPEPPD
jgi:hypothetical protein